MLNASLLLPLLSYIMYCIFLVIAAGVQSVLKANSGVPDGIPWVGDFRCSITKLLAPWMSVFRGPQLLEESYQKVCGFQKRGKKPVTLTHRLN